MNLFSRGSILSFPTQDKMYRSYGTLYAGLIVYNGLKPIVTIYIDPTGLDKQLKNHKDKIISAVGTIHIVVLGFNPTHIHHANHQPSIKSIISLTFVL